MQRGDIAYACLCENDAVKVSVNLLKRGLEYLPKIPLALLGSVQIVGVAVLLRVCVDFMQPAVLPKPPAV